MYNNHNYLLPLLLSTILIAPTAANGQMYRYKNDQGTKVISDVIPPHYATKGYDVIDSRGDVIKTVPPELSPEEKEIQRKKRLEQARLDEWDRELRSRYHSVEDIESAKSRRLKGIDNSINSLKLTLDNISGTIKYYQAEAAANERLGEAASKDTLASMARLQKDRDFIEKEIAGKESQREAIIDSFNRDAERFKLIFPKR